MKYSLPTSHKLASETDYLFNFVLFYVMLRNIKRAAKQNSAERINNWYHDLIS